MRDHLTKLQIQSYLAPAGLACLLVLGSSGCNSNFSIGGGPFGMGMNTKQASEERRLTLEHKAGSGLEVRTTFGAISVVADPALTNVEVTATVFASGATAEQARTNLTKIAVKTQRRADQVLEIWAEYPRNVVVNGGCSFEVRIPDATGVIAKSANGAVALRGLGGAAEAETTFGSVTVTGQHGPATVHSANGSVTLEQIEGAAQAQTSFGGITVRAVQGDVAAHSSNGSVEVAKVKGSVQAGTTFGSLTVREVGGEVKANNANGPIRVEQARGRVAARTTFGTVSVREGEGEAEIESSNGSITYAPAKGNAHPFNLKTTFGTVEVRLPASAAGRIHATTSFGSITVDGARRPLSVTGEKGDRQIVLTETGRESRIASANGSIHVSLDQVLAERE